MLGRLPDDPHPCAPLSKRLEDQGLSEATQSLFCVRGVLTKWGFLIKTDATLICPPPCHLGEFRLWVPQLLAS